MENNGEVMDCQDQDNHNTSGSSTGSCNSSTVTVVYSGYDDWQDPSRDYVRARRRKGSLDKGLMFESSVGYSQLNPALPGYQPPPNAIHRRNPVVITPPWNKKPAVKRDATGNIIIPDDENWLPGNKTANTDLRENKCSRN